MSEEDLENALKIYFGRHPNLTDPQKDNIRKDKLKELNEFKELLKPVQILLPAVNPKDSKQ